MFKFLLALFLFSFLNIRFTNGDCSVEEGKKIEKCYSDNFFAANLSMPKEAQPFHDTFLSVLLDDKKFGELCVKKVAFDTCVGDSSISGCFNANDFFAKVPIAKSSNDARMFVTNYLQMNYTCGRGYPMIPNLYHCAMSMPDPCRNVTNKYANCQNAAALISCENAIAIKQCGVAAACLYKKFSTLESCNQPNLGNCDICPSLTAAKNPIAALCDDDQWNSSPQTFVSILALFLIIFINFFLQA